MKQYLQSIILILLIVGGECSHLKSNNNAKNRRQYHRNTLEQNDVIVKSLNKNQNNIKISIQQENQTVESQIQQEDSEQLFQQEENGEGQQQLQEEEVLDIQENSDGQLVSTLYVSPVEQTPENAWQQLAEESETFEAFYNLYKSLIQEDLDALVAERATKNQECSIYNVEIEELEFSYQKTQDYIAWLTVQISQNTAKIDKIFAERCEAHQIFIEYYKNAKVTLRLISFLKEAIVNYNMIQLKQVGNIMTQFMNPALLSNKDAMKTMLSQLKQVDGGNTYDQVGDSLEEQEKARTAEEIGDDHVDNEDSQQIVVDEFQSSERRLMDDYKVEIINMLEDIRTNIQGEINRRQDDEIELNDRVVAFVEKIEIENQSLNSESEQQRSAIVEFQANLNIQIYLQETCQGDLQWLDDVISAQTLIQDYVVNNSEVIQIEYDAYQLTLVIQEEIIEEEDIQQVIEVNDKTVWDGETLDLSNQEINGIRIPDSALEKMTIGFSWNAEEGTDLDSAVLIANAESEIVDRVYRQNQVSADYSIQSLGESSTADVEGDNETISFQLNTVDSTYETLYIIISIYDDNNLVFFQGINEISINIYVGGSVFVTYVIDPSSSVNSHQAATYLLVEIYRNQNDGGAWYLKPTDVYVYLNADTTPVRDAMATGLQQTVSSLGQGTYASESAYNWTSEQGTYNLPYGGNGLQIPAIGLGELTVGLAWDAGNLDLDASIIMANSIHEVVDRVFYGKLYSNDSSVQHLGDAQSGETEGDDEQIVLKLQEVSSDVEHLYVLLTIYDDNVYFNDVDNAKITLYIGGDAFMVYNLQSSQISDAQNSPAYILVEVYRNQEDAGNWWIKQVGMWLNQDNNGNDIRDSENLGVDEAISSITEQQSNSTIEQVTEIVEVNIAEWEPSTGETFDLSSQGAEGIRIPDSAFSGLNIGLSWSSGETDLDSAILCANSDSQIIDRVFWNKLVSEDQGIESLGDNRTGEGEGDDETITVLLNNIDSAVETMYVIISIYDQENLVFFQDINEASVNIYVGGSVFVTYVIDPSSSVNSHQAATYLLVEIYRNQNDGGAWYLKPTDVYVYLNADTTPVRDAMATGLQQTVSSLGQGTYASESAYNWTSEQGTYNLPYGGNGLQIPAIGLGELTVGLSWDAGDIDLDASIIMANSIHEVVDRVFWGNLVSRDFSIEHLGDALTGEAGGDDETIVLKLQEVSSDVEHLYVLLSIYDDQVYFNDVNNAKITLYIGEDAFMNYNLESSLIDGATNSPTYILVEVYRNQEDEGNWWIKQVGLWLYKDNNYNDIRDCENSGIDKAIAAIIE